MVRDFLRKPGLYPIFITILALAGLVSLSACTLSRKTGPSISAPIQDSGKGGSEPIVGEGCETITLDEPSATGTAECGDSQSGNAASFDSLAEGDKSRLLGTAVILFRRTGALTGLQQSWSIFADGRIEGSDGSSDQITAKKVDQTLQEIEKLGFFEMGSEYMERSTCCHQYTYFLVIQNGQRYHELATLDGADNAPDNLDDILSLVSGLVLVSQ